MGEDDTRSAGEEDDGGETIRVWLVERTFSDDEQNIVILLYATTDGLYYYRKERALTSFSDTRETTAATEVERSNLGAVADPAVRTRYAEEASRMAEEHDPDDAI